MNNLLRRIAGMLGLPALLGAALTAGAAESELLQYIPEDANAVYSIDAAGLRALPAVERIRNWPEVAAYFDVYMTTLPGAPAPDEVIVEALVAFNSLFPGKQPPMSVVLRAEDPAQLRRLIDATGLRPEADQELPTYRSDDLAMRELNDRVLLLTVNDPDGKQLVYGGSGPSSSTIRHRIKSFPDDALAWMVIESLQDLMPRSSSSERGTDKTNPLENVISDIHGIYGVIEPLAGDPDGIVIKATIICDDSNKLAMQSQLGLALGTGLLFANDFELGSALLKSLKLTPGTNRVDYTLTLNGKLFDRLVGFAEKQLRQENSRRSGELGR